MGIIADFHMHSHNSEDSEESMEAMILRGIELGFKSMCFTEHQDIDFHDPHIRDNAFSLNTDSYLYELLGLREKYKDQINVLFGVEIGMQPHLRKELALYAKAYEFDYIIGSVHLIGGRDPYYEDYYEGKTDEEVYREFFVETMKNLKIFSNFDVLGHLDYIVRYGRTKDRDYSYDKYKDVIDPILEWLVEHEKGLELNTKGGKFGMKDFNPCKDIVKKYRELGGEIITIGSDAHKAEEMGRDFDEAVRSLKECGFDYYTTFEKRTPEFHKIVL